MEDLELCYWLMHIVHEDHDFEVVDWKFVNFDFSKTTVLFVKVKFDDNSLDVYGFWDWNFEVHSTQTCYSDGELFSIISKIKLFERKCPDV